MDSICRIFKYVNICRGRTKTTLTQLQLQTAAISLYLTRQLDQDYGDDGDPTKSTKWHHDKWTVNVPNKTTYNSGHNFNIPAFTPTGIDGWRGSKGIESAAPEMAL